MSRPRYITCYTKEELKTELTKLEAEDYKLYDGDGLFSFEFDCD